MIAGMHGHSDLCAGDMEPGACQHSVLSAPAPQGFFFFMSVALPGNVTKACSTDGSTGALGSSSLVGLGLEGGFDPLPKVLECRNGKKSVGKI